MVFKDQSSLSDLLYVKEKMDPPECTIRLTKSSALYILSANGMTNLMAQAIHGGANVNGGAEDKTLPLHAAAMMGYGDAVGLLLERNASIDAFAPVDPAHNALMYAASFNHVQVVVLLLEKGANVNLSDPEGITALHIAAKLGHLEVVRLLLDQGAEINKQKLNGATALYVAAQDARTAQVVSLLVERGADVNTVSHESGSTPLMEASYFGRLNVVRLLLNSRADASMRNPIDGSTALYLAAQNGLEAIVELLLDARASVNDVKSDDNTTALFEATRAGHFGVMALLLERGAPVDQSCTDQEISALYCAAQTSKIPEMCLLLNHGACVDSCPMVNGFGITVLMAAAFEGSVRVMTVLLERGANLNRVGENGDSAIHLAAFGGHPGAVSLLIQYRADINVRRSSDGTTPLFAAAAQGHFSTVDTLIRAGASLSTASTVTGSFPLMAATVKNHYEVVKHLLHFEADVNQVNLKNGTNALYCAALQRNRHIMETLVAHGAEVNSHNEEWTTLSLIVRSRCEYIVHEVLRCGAKVNVVNPGNGGTPLSTAAEIGDEDLVEELLDRGANINQVADEHGNSSLHIAAAKGHDKVLALLLNRRADPNQLNHYGCNALHMLSMSERDCTSSNCAILVLEFGCSLEAVSSNRLTPTHQAKKEKNLRLLSKLRQVERIRAKARAEHIFENETKLCTAEWFIGNFRAGILLAPLAQWAPVMPPDTWRKIYSWAIEGSGDSTCCYIVFYHENVHSADSTTSLAMWQIPTLVRKLITSFLVPPTSTRRIQREILAYGNVGSAATATELSNAAFRGLLAASTFDKQHKRAVKRVENAKKERVRLLYQQGVDEASYNDSMRDFILTGDVNRPPWGVYRVNVWQKLYAWALAARADSTSCYLVCFYVPGAPVGATPGAPPEALSEQLIMWREVINEGFTGIRQLFISYLVHPPLTRRMIREMLAYGEMRLSGIGKNKAELKCIEARHKWDIQHKAAMAIAWKKKEKEATATASSFAASERMQQPQQQKNQKKNKLSKFSH